MARKKRWIGTARPGRPTVVDDLTDLAALGGGAPLNMKSLDIAALIESESQMSISAARRKNIVLAVDLKPPSLIVKIDGGRVRQVVIRLSEQRLRGGRSPSPPTRSSSLRKRSAT